MSSPSEIIYLKQQQAEQLTKPPVPEKKDYSLEEVKAMSKEEKGIALQSLKIKPSKLSQKVLLGKADFSLTEIRTLKQSPDSGAREYITKLTQGMKNNNKAIVQKTLMNMDCQRELSHLALCFVQN